MVRVELEFFGNDLFKLILHLARVFARRQSGAICDAEDMRIDRYCRQTKSDVQDDIRGFSSNAGESLKRFAVSWYFSLMLLHEHFR